MVQGRGDADDSLLLYELASLFHTMQHGRKKSTTLSPKRFYSQLKAENGERVESTHFWMETGHVHVRARVCTKVSE